VGSDSGDKLIQNPQGAEKRYSPEYGRDGIEAWERAIGRHLMILARIPYFG
jgi:hypothetical protein